MPLVTLDVKINERAGIQAAVSIPDITRSARVGNRNFSETFSGLGDTSILTWYRLAPRARWYVVLNGGLSLPTGRTEAPRFREELEDGSLVPLSRLQRGSGTLDPLIGVSAERRVAHVNVFLSAAARVPVARNEHGLRTGASWETSGGVATELFSHVASGYARVGWLHREQDAFNGTPVLVGGGDWIYFTPGVAVRPFLGLTMQAEVKLPVYRNLSNRQLDSRAVFQFGVSRAF